MWDSACIFILSVCLCVVKVVASTSYVLTPKQLICY